MIGDKQRILVINTMCIGDLVLSTPLFRALKNSFPRAHLAVLVNRNYGEILIGNPNVDEIIHLEKKGRHKSLAGMWKLIQNIRKQKFDLVINLTNSARANLITLFSGASKKISYPPFIKKHSGKQHKVEDHLNLLKQLTFVSIRHQGLEVFPTREVQRFVEAFLEENGVGKEDLLIGLNSGASWPNKKWGKKKFAQLADRLVESYGAKVIFLGGLEDKHAVADIVALMKNKPIIATGQTSLQQLAALLEECRILITGDTGPLHIAVGVKTPVISLFGPSSSDIYGPYGAGNYIINKRISCSPCNENKFCEKNECMKSISVEDVLASVALMKECD